MAGYRPKSLDELNDMYDKTITAEKAIIKATRQLHDVTETIATSDSVQEEPMREEARTVEELSSEVDSLINRFKEEKTVREPSFVRPYEPEPVIEEPVAEAESTEISFEKEIQALAEIKAEEKAEEPVIVPEIQKPRTHYSLEVPSEVTAKAVAKSDERTDLFDDYMKIMNDDDDEAFTFKKKEKKKKHKKGLFFRHEPKEETTEESEEEAQIEEAPVSEVVFSPEETVADESFTVEYDETDEAEPSEEITSPSDFSPEGTDSDEADVHSGFHIITDEPKELPDEGEETENEICDNYTEDTDDIYSFDPSKANTIPEYAKEQYADEDTNEEELYSEEEYDEDAPEFSRPKNKKGVIAGRIFLSIIFSLLLVFDAGLIAANYILNVNTGNAAFGDKYIFTADRNYTNANILEGDLIITEKRYANDGEAFAYINYTQQCFMFGKRSGSIVNDSDDILFIAENDGERVLVLRDDTRGVVSATYPGIGKVVSFCAENFILIIAFSLVIGLIIILLLSFVLKDKEKAYEKMIKKMIRKGVISAEEEADYNYTEEPEEEDLFSTIE